MSWAALKHVPSVFMTVRNRGSHGLLCVCNTTPSGSWVLKCAYSCTLLSFSPFNLIFLPVRCWNGLTGTAYNRGSMSVCHSRRSLRWCRKKGVPGQHVWGEPTISALDAAYYRHCRVAFMLELQHVCVTVDSLHFVACSTFSQLSWISAPHWCKHQIEIFFCLTIKVSHIK